MQIITDHQSPNFNDRRHGAKPTYIVLHYTGMESGAAALARLCDAEAGVSAHYLIEEDGRIFQLVDEDKRAWHAGAGQWRDCDDLNSASIGIEIVNPGHEFGYRAFPERQIRALEALMPAILQRHQIAPGNVIGHSDLAPLRKEDPGELFPWARLARQGLSFWPGAGFLPPLSGPSLQEGNEAPDVGDIQRALATIGYKISADNIYGPETRAVVIAFQRRFRQDKIDGIADPETLALIGWAAFSL